LHAIESFIQENSLAAWPVMIVAFFILAKCADVFVDAAVALAHKFSIPKLVIGIVLVSLATTAPELAVSMMSALKGNPEMALGNAIGSVICDDGLALAFAGIIAMAPIAVMPRVLKTSGLFLLFIEIVAFIFVAGDYTLSRIEGVILVVLFAGYIFMLFRQHQKGLLQEDDIEENENLEKSSTGRIAVVFILGLAGIIFASEFIVVSATTIARSLSIPESVIALTLVAFGTSIPEVATCITAARKNHGDIAVGNILGADIMNICWVAGASAIANELTLGKKEVFFMFPAMFIIVGIMLLLLWRGYNLTKKKGYTLLALYVIYLITSFALFPPQKTTEEKIKDAAVKTTESVVEKTAEAAEVVSEKASGLLDTIKEKVKSE
jgi:cation:H+ antiporter